MNAEFEAPTGRGLVLVSHHLCPYVQRAAIVLAEKAAVFERIDVDLTRKPAWFRAISPLGKTPVLLVGGAPLFESAPICDYLDETIGPPLHPVDAFARARHRAWIAFASTVLDRIAALYNAVDAAAFVARRDDLEGLFAEVERALDADGPWFAGARFSLVDAAFAPAFRYFDAFERIAGFDVFAAKPRVVAWRGALVRRPSVIGAVAADYPARLLDFLRRRDREVSRGLPP